MNQEIQNNFIVEPFKADLIMEKIIQLSVRMTSSLQTSFLVSLMVR